MSKELTVFGNTEIAKPKSHQRKNLILPEDLDIDKILRSSRVSSSKKNYEHFVGYVDDHFKIEPSLIIQPKTNTYVKGFICKPKWMNSFIKDVSF